jgi:alpha-L-arabinofuranosidase
MGQKLNLSGWVMVCVMFIFDGTLRGQNSLTATIRVEATQTGAVIDGALFGTNLTNESRTADRTVHDAAFVAAAKQIGPRIVRFPGGNNADGYDWKNHVQIKPGRRVSWEGAITLPEIIAFCREIGAELSITVNFGTGTPEDAADLVEYLNGPADSEWGRVRASHGFPEPLNVRFFEIGNEINQPHQWYHSWTAEDPYKYFFGGEEERRGDYNASQNLDPAGKKGDVFKADGGSGQTYILRFPPVRNVRVFWAATQEDGRNGVFEEWLQVRDLQQHGPDAKVFELDSLAGTLTFGDGVHGAVPPQGSWFLVEYTTYGHKGFVDFARAMRQAPSSVPIKIGAVTGPFVQQTPIASEDSLRMIFEEMDFWISHQYGANFPTDSYARRRQMAYQRTQGTARARGSRMQSAVASLGLDKTLGIAITEWNIFLDEASWRLNRTQEAAVIAGEFFIRTLHADSEFPVWFANQFALGGVWLALYNNWTSFSIGPMGYVFEGFKPWRGTQEVPVEVESPAELAYDQVLPFINAAAARSTGGDTLLIAVTNSAETQPIRCRLDITGFDYAGGRLRRLEGDSPTAHNDGGNPFNVVLQEESLSAGEADSLLVQPHSVVFVELYAQPATSVDDLSSVPRDFSLFQNYPNPFNPETTIRFSLPRRQKVTLNVFDIQGRVVETLVDDELPMGEHAVVFNAKNLTSGVFFYRLTAGPFSQIRKAILVK